MGHPANRGRGVVDRASPSCMQKLSYPHRHIPAFRGPPVLRGGAEGNLLVLKGIYFAEGGNGRRTRLYGEEEIELGKRSSDELHYRI